MAARQISQYTDAQLNREALRVTSDADIAKTFALEPDEFAEAMDYRSDLFLERARRRALRAGVAA